MVGKSNAASPFISEFVTLIPFNTDLKQASPSLLLLITTSPQATKSVFPEIWLSFTMISPKRSFLPCKISITSFKESGICTFDFTDKFPFTSEFTIFTVSTGEDINTFPLSVISCNPPFFVLIAVVAT